MEEGLKLLDVVALLKNIPDKKLLKGQVGTIVEFLKQDYFEVEFCNKKGETLYTIPLHTHDLLLLRYELQAA
jgi:hypothetical protein